MLQLSLKATLHEPVHRGSQRVQERHQSIPSPPGFLLVGGIETSSGSVDHRRLVSHLAQLLNVIVPQKLNGLREQGRIFGADLTQYYNVLEDIDRRIVSQSQRITKEVDQQSKTNQLTYLFTNSSEIPESFLREPGLRGYTEEGYIPFNLL